MSEPATPVVTVTAENPIRDLFCRHCHRHLPPARIVAAIWVMTGPNKAHRQKQYLCGRCYESVMSSRKKKDAP